MGGHTISASVSHNNRYKHTIHTRTHELVIDEPAELGGSDAGPTPQELLAASLASCTAVTLQMYAERKDWDLGDLKVDCNYTTSERGCPTKFELVVKVPAGLSDEQIDRIRVIATKCPVHRILDGEVMFDERVEVIA